ncbi:hypothetical protein [Streptomyces sp. TRM68367]|uniref:hypothetical protein n=1 Tax=Streptomyces sp. TRM68367 TaxID=2758415 RepID=UPI00165C2747|nr:hypothetical protein [Streptomyces sp. TRM68367]MBC9724423.1 hypothetical protein [Streptomyces sp. TRM68367]
MEERNRLPTSASWLWAAPAPWTAAAALAGTTPFQKGDAEEGQAGELTGRGLVSSKPS